MTGSLDRQRDVLKKIIKETKIKSKKIKKEKKETKNINKSKCRSAQKRPNFVTCSKLPFHPAKRRHNLVWFRVPSHLACNIFQWTRVANSRTAKEMRSMLFFLFYFFSYHVFFKINILIVVILSCFPYFLLAFGVSFV